MSAPEPNPADVLAKAKAIVKQFYPEMPDNYEGRRVQIALAALRQQAQPTPDAEEPCVKCEASGDDCGEHVASWEELATYWKAEAERLAAQPTPDAMREALRFYAREANYRSMTMYMSGQSGKTAIEIDGGSRALAALQEQSK